MSNVRTRLASLRDISDVAVLFDEYRQFYEHPADIFLATTYIQERINKNESVIIVADDESRLVGFCQLYPSFCSLMAAPIFCLYDLFVSPRARKSGVGRTLLLAAEHHAAHNGYVRLDLTTAKTNLAAQALYDSLGWVRDEMFFTYSKSIKSI
jgi:ribosomal protein S18 acetylase RimI-like enzyme